MVRESLFLLLIIGAIPLACGGQTSRRQRGSDDAGAGGEDGGSSGVAGRSAGTAGKGNAGAGSGTGGSSSGNGGSGGAQAGTGASGGAGNAAGTAGNSNSGEGGEAGASGGSAGTAGTGGSGGLPIVNPTPTDGNAHELESGDTLNSTPPVLVSFGDGIVIAGYTRDPALAGVAAFPSGQVAETFAARLDHTGDRLWSTPLPGSGVPVALAVDPAGDIVILASFIADRANPLYIGSSTNDLYLAKLSPVGDILYARDIPYESGVIPYGLNVDASGAIYVCGGYVNPDASNNIFAFLAKFDSEGHEEWAKKFAHSGTWASADGIATLANGDVTITGGFNGNIDFGGGTLTTQAVYETYMMSNGFLARFTANGEHVSSLRFGGTVFDQGKDLVALSDGDLLVSGSISGVVEFGGKTADGLEGAPFLARLAPDGAARFFEAAPSGGTPYALVADPDERLFHLTGYFSGNHILFEFGPNGEFGLAATVGGSEIWSHSSAVDSARSLWVSGGFQHDIDFGHGITFEADDKGVFLVRLDRQ